MSTSKMMNDVAIIMVWVQVLLSIKGKKRKVEVGGIIYFLLLLFLCVCVGVGCYADLS